MRHFGARPGGQRSMSTHHHRARSDCDGLGLGLGLGSVEIASANPPPSSGRFRDGCRVYQVTPRKTPRADRLIVGIDRPPDGPKCPRASSQVQQARCTITLSARLSLAFVSQGHGSPAAPRRAVRNLDDGWDDLSRPRKKPPWEQWETWLMLLATGNMLSFRQQGPGY